MRQRRLFKAVSTALVAWAMALALVACTAGGASGADQASAAGTAAQTGVQAVAQAAAQAAAATPAATDPAAAAVATAAAQAVAAPSPLDNLYYYGQLNAAGQQAYEHLDKAFTAWLGDFGGGDTDFSTRIGLTDGMTEFDVIDAFQALELDNPLILDFFNGTVRLTLTNTSVLVEDVKTSADEQVFGDIGEVRQRALAVQYMADSFLAGLDPGLSDYQKYWYIAQKLAAQSTYDYAALAFYDAYPGQMPDTNALWLPTSIYGTLAWNTAICQGLTASYQYLCQRAGLFCMTVTGTTKGGSHAWNVIKLDDGYYNVDVTWMLGGDAERYFCLTDAQIRYDHTIDADGYPACQGSEYAYQGPLD